MASKTQKPSKGPHDRLSSLPDDVLAHILSSLPTKFAATTSVLSKRWRFLFHSASHIDFNEVSHFQIHFKEFVDGLLFSSYHSLPIQCLSLRWLCNNIRGREKFNSWILAKRTVYVEELYVNVTFYQGYEALPTEFFSRSKLRILRLEGGFIFNVPNSVNMVNLVDWHLQYAKFNDDGCLKKGLPSLKRLTLMYFVSNIEVLELVSQSLTNSIMDNDYNIALHTPNLECLEYRALWPGFLLVLQKLTLLSEVDIDFRWLRKSADKLNAYGQSFNKFMKEIHNVKSLRLTGTSLKLLGHSTCSLPIFHNLTTMELGLNEGVTWQTLAMLLESAPNLEVLHFVQGLMGCRKNKLKFENSLVGVLEHIRIIKIGDFRGKEFEFEMVKYLLLKGKFLEEVKICS